MRKVISILFLIMCTTCLIGCSNNEVNGTELIDYYKKNYNSIYSEEILDSMSIYGVFDGYVFYEIGPRLSNTPLRRSVIDGLEFVDYVSNGYGIKAFKNKEVYYAIELYNEGAISKETLSNVRIKHVEIHQNRYTTDYPENIELEKILDFKMSLRVNYYSDDKLDIDDFVESKNIYGVFGGYVIYSMIWFDVEPSEIKLGDFTFIEGNGINGLFTFKDGRYDLLKCVYESNSISNNALQEFYDYHTQIHSEWYLKK